MSHDSIGAHHISYVYEARLQYPNGQLDSRFINLNVYDVSDVHLYIKGRVF